MATIEITPALLISALMALGSLLTTTIVLSRRSQGWDDATKVKRIVLDGDPENGKPSLITKFDKHKEDTEREIASLKAKAEESALYIRALKRALNAHGSGSDEHVIVSAVHDTIDKRVREEIASSSQARRAIIVDQERRFDAREYEVDDDPFPSPPPPPMPRSRQATPLRLPTPPHLPAYKPIPREDPPSEDDPSEQRRRKRT